MEAAVDAGRSGERGGGASVSLAVRAKEAAHRVLGVALILVVGANVFNATGRYVLGYSFTGTDEFMVYTMIWVVMAGAVMSLASREHIGINLLPFYARGRLRHFLHCIHDLTALLACGYATYASAGFVTRIARLGTESMGLGLPMTVPHAALLAGFAALTLVAGLLLSRSVLALMRGEPHAEEGS